MPFDHDAIDELRSVSNMDAVHVVQHYLYFPLEQAAQTVANLLRQRGFAVEERLGADGINWLVLARNQMVPTEAEIGQKRQLLEEIAEENGGEYDGWEAEVQSGGHGPAKSDNQHEG